MKKVLELVRVSTLGQGEEDRAGIPAQRDINRQTAAKYGLQIVKTIQLIDVSGAQVLQTPEMRELLRLIESPDIVGVVAKEFSRLMRPEKFTDFALLGVFIETKTLLYLPDGPIDLCTKTGQFMGTIRAAIAGLERHEIRERMQDAKESMRRAGKHPGGSKTLPFGVGYSKERGWYYTSEAAKVKEAFEMFLSGRFGYAEIARELTIPRTTLRYIMENRIYAGVRVYDQKRDPSSAGYIAGQDGRQGYRKKIKRPAAERIAVPVLEGLIGEQQFARAQQLIGLKIQKHWRGRVDQPRRYTYNGFLTCGECGELLYTHTSQNAFYICKTRHTRERRARALLQLEPCTNRHMLRDKLEPQIDRLIASKLQNPEFIKRALTDYSDVVARSATTQNIGTFDQASIRQKLSHLTSKRERILESFYDAIIDGKERDRQLELLQREIAVYQRLFEASSEVNVRSAPDLETVLQILEPLGNWELLGREDKRALLRQLCPEISVYRYAIKTVTLNLNTSVNRPDCDNDSPSKTAR